MSGWAAAPRSKEMSSKRIAKRAANDMSLEKARKAIRKFESWKVWVYE